MKQTTIEKELGIEQERDIAVVIPVRNCAPKCLRLLTELFSQRKRQGLSQHNLGVIVIDDLSTDGTTDLVQNLILMDNRGIPAKDCVDGVATNLSVFGAGGSRNRGVLLAKKIGFKFIVFLDADDFISSRFVETLWTNYKRFGKCKDCFIWGFVTIKPDCNNAAWVPKFKEKDEWISAPVAPWIHMIRTELVAEFPERISTDDVIWWIRQADRLAQAGGKVKAIEYPLYVYDKSSGGCTRASDYFTENPMTLEGVIKSGIMRNRGFNPKYVSDCLRNLAELYDMYILGEIKDRRVNGLLCERIHNDYAAIMTGRWGW